MGFMKSLEEVWLGSASGFVFGVEGFALGASPVPGAKIFNT